MDKLIRRSLILLLCAVLLLGNVRMTYALRPAATGTQPSSPEANPESYLPDIIPTAEAYEEYAKANDKGDTESALNWHHTALFYFFTERFDHTLYCLNRAYTIYNRIGNRGKALEILQLMYSVNHYQGRFLSAAYIAEKAIEINVKGFNARKIEMARWRLLEVDSLFKSGKPEKAASKALIYAKEAVERGIYHKTEQFLEQANRYYEGGGAEAELKEIARLNGIAMLRYKYESAKIEKVVKEAQGWAGARKPKTTRGADKFVQAAKRYEEIGNDQEAAKWYYLASTKYMVSNNLTLPSVKFAVKNGWLNFYLGNFEVAQKVFLPLAIIII